MTVEDRVQRLEEHEAMVRARERHRITAALVQPHEPHQRTHEHLDAPGAVDSTGFSEGVV